MAQTKQTKSPKQNKPAPQTAKKPVKGKSGKKGRKKKKQNDKQVIIVLLVILGILILGLVLLFRVLLPGPEAHIPQSPEAPAEISSEEPQPEEEEKHNWNPFHREPTPDPTPEPTLPLPLSSLKQEYFTRYYNYVSYEDPAYTTAMGIDVSSHQGSIDWQTVKDFGMEFAIIRAGFRGYSAGDLNEDDYFRANMDGAAAAGMDIGVYFFSQAITPEEAVEEAEMVLKLVEGYDLKYPVYYDWELVESDTARTNVLTIMEITACAKAFCDTIEGAGYEAGMYFNLDAAANCFQLGELKDYTFWLAEYRDYPSYPFEIAMWQYADSGTVPGIDANVDLNMAFFPNT